MYKLFFLYDGKDSEINVYTNKKYILSITEKQILTDRLKNDIFFDRYQEKIEQYVEVRLNKDEKEEKAWGTVSLILDKNLEKELKEILLQMDEIVSTDSRTYGVVDDYGSIYIEKSYLYGLPEKIKLVFSVNLPYEYNSEVEYNEHIKFFLKFNN